MRRLRFPPSAYKSREDRRDLSLRTILRWHWNRTMKRAA